MQVLTVNTGSTSVRLAVFDCRAANGTCTALARESIPTSDGAPAERLAQFVRRHAVDPLNIIVHRVVHGGRRHSVCRLDRASRDEIAQQSTLAPLHNPRALQWIQASGQVFGALPQFAAFDTAFFSELPEHARAYALPPAFAREHGIQRYGFHGLAHQAMWQRWQALQPRVNGRGRIITLQLGGGCSAAAIADGAPRETSMGFSPLEGLMMATRCGDLDAQAVLYMQRELGQSIAQIEALLNERSGLLGVSGISADMQELLANPAPSARFAIELYCHRVRKYVGAYLAVLAGADAVVFGGGVGEHAATIRAQILDGMEWAGIQIDARQNVDAVGSERCISRPDSPVQVWVLPVDEAALMARQAVALIQAEGAAP